MKPVQIARKIGSWRWEATLVLSVLVIAAIAVAALWGTAIVLKHDNGILAQEQSMARRSNTWQQELASAKSRIVSVNKLMGEIKSREPFNEAVVLATLYSLADSVGFRPSRIQIGEAIVLEKGREIPVVVEGTGAYASIGKFTEGIENAAFATRIRSLSINGTGSDAGTVSYDFIIMDEQIGQVMP